MNKLPLTWENKKLFEVGEIITGNTPSKKDSTFYENGSIPFVKPPDLGKGMVYSSEEKINEKGLEKSRLIPKNSIMVCCIGSLGKIGIAGVDLITNQQINTIVFNKNLVLFKFGYYYALTLEKYMNSVANKAVVAIINKSTFSNFDFPLPPLPEQTRIVNKLESFFERIDKSIVVLEENILYTQALKNSFIENTFIRLFKYSKILKVKEIADIKGGKRLPKGETVLDEKTDYPYIRVTDFNDHGSIDLTNLKYLKKEVQEQIKRYIITSKDLYISIAGTIGKTGIIPKDLDNANLTENAARLVFKSNLKINNRFIYYFTLSSNFKEQVGLATKAVAQPKLALTRLAEVEIPIPSLEMQDKEVKEFDLISFKTHAILRHQQSKLAYLKALKASLLDNAFKGEL